MAAAKKDPNPVLDFLKQNSRIRDICTTPMIATIVAALYENDYDLPQSRAEVYQKRFDLLLERWDKVRGVPRRTNVRPGDKLLFLSRLALRLHKDHRRRFTAKDAEAVWIASFAPHYSGTTVADLLWELQVCNSVVIPEGDGEYSLGHLSYQEYLAALAVVRGQELRKLRSRYYEPWWRQVIVFAAGIAGDISPLIDALLKTNTVSDNRGLLREMMQEAKNTPRSTLDALGEFYPEGMVKEGDRDLEELDEALIEDPKGDDDEEEVEGAAESESE